MSARRTKTPTRLGRARATQLARRVFPDSSNRDIRYHERPEASEAVAVHDGDVIHLLAGKHVRVTPERHSSAA